MSYSHTSPLGFPFRFRDRNMGNMGWGWGVGQGTGDKQDVDHVWIHVAIRLAMTQGLSDPISQSQSDPAPYVVYEAKRHKWNKLPPFVPPVCLPFFPPSISFVFLFPSFCRICSIKNAKLFVTSFGTKYWECIIFNETNQAITVTATPSASHPGLLAGSPVRSQPI